MKPPPKPTPNFPLYAHRGGQWAKKINGKTAYFGPWSNPQAALNRYLEQQPKPSNAKPCRDFPLSRHRSGQWCRKVRGRTYYFGVLSNPQAALERWNREKDSLLAGQTRQRSGLTIADLVNAFLTAKQRRVESGELTRRSFHEYDKNCAAIIAAFGRQRPVESLRPADFGKLRAQFATTHGPVRLVKDITLTKTLFNFAVKNSLIEKSIKFGDEFAKPSRATLRKARQKNGPRMFTPIDIQAMLKAASPQLRAMILLGINCGFGNTDCARLTTNHIRGMWVNFPRPKTGIDRRCPLWPETRAAIAAIERPTPKNPQHANHIFITKYGFTWEPKGISDAPISAEIRKLLRSLGRHRLGLNFYALRHTFQTIGEKSRDKDAVRCIMGHAESANDMSAVYNEERPDDKRLLAVVKFVRRWTFSRTLSRPASTAAAE